MGTSPFGVSSDGTHVWVANCNDNTVTELNASTGSVVQTIGVGSDPDGVSSDGTHVWVANAVDNTVTEIAIANGPLQITTTSLPDATVGQSPTPSSSRPRGDPALHMEQVPAERKRRPADLAPPVEEWPHLRYAEEGGHLRDHRQVSGGNAHPHKTVVTQELTLTVNP